MKTLINYRNLVTSVLLMASLVFTTAANAGDDKKPKDDKNNIAAELKFIGNYRNQPMFELTFKNPAIQTDYTVIVRDSYGNPLYRDVLNSSIASKRFMLNMDEIGSEPLRFEITNRKTNKSAVYEVNQSSRTIEEVNVVKVN